MSNGTRLHHFKVKIAVEPVIGHCSEISSYHTLFLIITGDAIGVVTQLRGVYCYESNSMKPVYRYDAGIQDSKEGG
jgi:hypothetical protein